MKRTILICVFWLLAMPVAALAESYIYLTNNTNQTLYLNIKQSGSSLNKGEHWRQHATEVGPLATVKVFDVNRDQGIKWGKTYYFDTEVTATDGSRFSLKQRLIGTWNFSEIGHGANDSAYYEDRDLYKLDTTFGGKAAKLAFRAQYARVGGDDFYYVIHPEQTSPSVGNADQFNVLAYNVWALLPGLASKSVSERLSRLAGQVDGYDAIVFSELFDNSSRETFLNAIKHQYPYQTDVVDRWGALEDGGVVIVSRWPIVTERQITYDDCDGDDCIAAKGVMYAAIDKQGVKYHLFGSHTQAWAEPQNQATRADQFRQMKTFIDNQNIPASEAVLIAGDLNVDKAHFPNEHSDMLTRLNAEEAFPTSGYPYTADGRVNAWTDGSPEFLDYVLYSKAHKQPVQKQAAVLAPRSIHSSVFTEYDLSDHFAVEAILKF